ncbi:FliM/FliN family flagellar motor switch protein [Roseicyclus mahoneyensis]|uniref:Flagellar motor switch protein FliM n=1 Tax=Roseicyclus mahoneyensis TaxID=164332 RepID=A0A316H3G8_9RHOB|nr:flagellar motor switch protein FliM [Roseicyclus mahoneyensis]PWK62053.1 flagellar motor switch protein FliM [Roseicyclus mahoneyensis]
MTLSVDPTVLRRKIAAHARPPAAPPDAVPQAIRALGRALRHAATPFDGLGLMPSAITVTAGCDLDGLVAGLPDHGLIAALEAEGGARGLLAVGPGLIDALVEVQTTGRIEAAELPPRPVTRIDEALVRDFIDLALAALGREAGGIAGRDWPARMAYGSRIRDRGQINLLMPDGAYTVMSAGLGFDGVERRSRVVLALPQSKLEGAGPTPAAGPVADPGWIAARARMLDALPLSVEAVLMRLTRPLARVEGLAVGDVLPFDASDLQAVRLEAAGGRVVATGRLGQSGGRRALRLNGQVARAPSPAPTTSTPVPVPDPMPAAVSLPGLVAR